MMTRWLVALSIVFFSVPLAASADEGRIEINQVKALAGGVVRGDSAGFPVTIGEPGSYILTGPLTVPDENTTAIEITAEPVTLDLNGFEISGPTVCTYTGSGITCTPTGSGYGIYATGLRTTVRNGFVQGMGYNGVEVSASSRVMNVTATHNGASGIVTNDSSSVVGSESTYNGGIGIYGSTRCLIQGNVSTINGSTGIQMGGSSVVIENSVSLNASWGIYGGGILDPLGYGSNVLVFNNGGNANPQVGGLVAEIGTNVCATNTTCP